MSAGFFSWSQSIAVVAARRPRIMASLAGLRFDSLCAPVYERRFGHAGPVMFGMAHFEVCAGLGPAGSRGTSVEGWRVEGADASAFLQLRRDLASRVASRKLDCLR